MHRINLMNNKLLIVLLILMFSNFYSYAQIFDTVKNPANEYVKSFEKDSLLQNPSEHTICKITADFNCDGINDIAISDSYLCGAHACSWDIYLGLKEEEYKYFSKLWFNNYAIRIDSIDNGKSKIYIENL